MRLFFCLVITIHVSFSVTPQNSPLPVTELNNLVSEYNKVFLHTKSMADEILKESTIKNNEVLDLFLYDTDIVKNNLIKSNTSFNELNATTDFGLKWMSDATYNFSPGISETEDVFFRSRISAGLDWVILGEGSMQRKKETKKIFYQQVLQDSIQLNLQNNSYNLQNRQLFLKHIFDLHRLDILKKYLTVLKLQAAYQNKMYKSKLSSNADKINADNQAEAVIGMITVYENYLSENIPQYLVKKYWNIPYVDTALPELSEISDDNLLQEEELLVKMQKDLLTSRHKPGEQPSLRAKFRYNYYDNAEQTGRSFASVGVSLSVPIRFGKDTQAVAYERATYDNNLYYEKLKLKDRLYTQHKDFYLLKSKLFQLQNDISYVQALLENETEVYLKQNKNFSPAKYIEYAGMLVHKKMAVLDIKEQLSEKFIIFQTLKGADNNKHTGTFVNNISLNVGTTYLWKDDFETIANDSLLARLNILNVDTLLISPGNNKAKIIDFLQKARTKNMHVFRLLSENSYAVDPDGVEKLLLKLQSMDKYDFSGIHLNIEPHTFSDYKENSTLYSERMNNIYSTATQWCNLKGIPLSVSIPLNLPLANAVFLANNNVTAYIMAYENTDQQKLLHRTELLRSTLQNNFVWVLRVSDFSTRQDLLNSVSFLKANGISRIALYDFSTVTKML